MSNNYFGNRKDWDVRRKLSNISFELPNNSVNWKDNDEADNIDNNLLKAKSEKKYQDIVTQIVSVSTGQLDKQNESKK